MLLKPFRIQSLSQYTANQRSPQIIKCLLWLGRFSNFYGEYTGRSLQARQQWLQTKLAEEKTARKPNLLNSGEGIF
ncbi:MAG: hypothetical protein AAF703_04370 [Cyanobacteria bacterium P01_D01_bin.105]